MTKILTELQDIQSPNLTEHEVYITLYTNTDYMIIKMQEDIVSLQKRC